MVIHTIKVKCGSEYNQLNLKRQIRDNHVLSSSDGSCNGTFKFTGLGTCYPKEYCFFKLSDLLTLSSGVFLCQLPWRFS